MKYNIQENRLGLAERLARSAPLHIALILLLGALVYSNTLHAPFAFDDIQTITENPRILDASNIPSFFAGGKGTFSSRPLMLATFALNYRFGGFDTTGYHEVNLALHLLNCVLLYLLVLMTGRHKGFADDGVRAVALLTAALFAVHPVQTEAVTYIVSRSMLFSTTFYLLGLILFLKTTTASRRNNLYLSLLFAAAILGAASRENFAAFPLMLLLYDLFFISDFSAEKVKGHLTAYLPAAVSLLYLAHLATRHTYAQADQYLGEGIPPLRYVLTEFEVHWSYLRLLIAPAGQNIDPDYPVAASFLEPKVLLSLAGYLGLWVAGIAMARRRPAPAFGALWFLIALIPVSFALAAFQARLDDVMFEHRLYLPAAGVFIAASALAVGAGGKLRSAGARKAAVAVAAIVVLALAAGAYQRNTVWQSGVSLWGDVVKKSPEKVRGYNNLGNAYGNSGDTERGIENLAKALALRPEMQVSKYYYSEINYNLAVLYARNGLTEKAEEHYKESVSLRPTPDAYNNLGAIYFERGQTDEAIEFYRKALDTDARYVNAHFNLGEAYLKRGMTSLAIKHYLEFLKYRPDNAQAHEDLARAYSASGQDDKSDEQARIARELRSRR